MERWFLLMLLTLNLILSTKHCDRFNSESDKWKDKEKRLVIYEIIHAFVWKWMWNL